VPILCLLCVYYAYKYRYRKLLVDCAEWSVHGSNDDDTDANISSNSDSHKHNGEQTSATQHQVTATTIALQLSDTLQSLYTVSKHSSGGADIQINEDTAAITETTSLTKPTIEHSAVQYRADALYTHTDAIAEVNGLSFYNKYMPLMTTCLYTNKSSDYCACVLYQ
jgi:hypothetical protein